MKTIKGWLMSLFQREEVEEYNADDDPFVLSMRRERKESRERRQQRREPWSENSANALEKELLGRRKA